MKKILFATDFSNNANKAFGFALSLAEKHKADLILLHVFDIQTVWTYPYTHSPYEVKTQAKKSWERSLKEFYEHYDTKVKASYVSLKINLLLVEFFLQLISISLNLWLPEPRVKVLLKNYYLAVRQRLW